ncbi:leucyl/phenylalanyl-tRNA--protein transferase [Maritalea mediterranea]|uniref:Leucyl/phenylalanyl-tRNA--protein transferase n=1 Tax=Maritalea mediterranea TaxID=2909667 RepID=A0ABS9EAF4_9HYPH|nr:leucyl/phenylalanyl-tRNA--protein transferase [Maritalea mediterranea]MCF4099848.1 leucyl/phenylalanyl-tRNA--protein transferase [Maritalea mediterranea]
MMHDDSDPYAVTLTPDMILGAYAHGIFPMAESADSPDLFWVDPEYRGIIPLDGLHISKSLRKVLKKKDYEVRFDHDFDLVISQCAAPMRGREETWINPEIKSLYRELFDRGFCHTVEIWRDNEIIGGLYGLALGGAFFGESMFHRATNGSKIALVELVNHLNAKGFVLLDTQFTTPHLETLGAIEITRTQYHARLAKALKTRAQF